MPPRNRHKLPLPILRWRGLTLQLLVLIILPITAILLLIIFGSLSLHQRAMRNLVGERDERAAHAAASSLVEQLTHRGLAIRNLAQRAADNIPLSEIIESSTYLYPDFEAGIAFFSHQGELLASNGSQEMWEDISDVTKTLIERIIISDGTDVNYHFSSPIIRNNENDLVVLTLSTAGESSPIAVGAFDPASLAQRALTGAIKSGEQTFAFVAASRDIILYQTGDNFPLEDLSQHPGLADALRGESGATYIQIDRSEHVIAFSPISPTGWALLIEEPWELVTSPLLNTTQFAPLILVPVLILALIALWFSARQIVTPLQKLEALASDLAWGDFQAIEEPVGGIEEINRLQNTLMHMARKVNTAQQGLRGYIGAITTGQEEERLRLSRELHDDTIQSLIALNQRVQLAQMSQTDEAVSEQLVEIQQLTEKTIQDLRRLTRDLRPLYLEDLGLVAALDMLAQETSKAIGIPVDFHRSGIERRLTPEIELTLYRMAQEGLSNISKHAEATSAIISITFTSQNTTMSITDDGRGFDVPESPAEFAPSGHFGLLGLHERAELVGAHLEIHSAPDQGTRLVITLQTPSEEA